jgi:hypothetical protein
MPYKKKSYRKKPAAKSRYKRRGSYSNKTYRGAGLLQGRSMRELKYSDRVRDDEASPQQISTSGTELTSDNICAVAQGTTASTRIGRKISVKSLEIRAALELNKKRWDNVTTPGNSNGMTTNRVRLLVVVDKQTNGSPNGNLSNILTQADVDGMRNLEYQQRFKVLYDKTFNFNSPGQQAAGSSEIYAAGVRKKVHIFKRFKKPLTIMYNGTSGLNTELTSNSIAVWAVSDFNDGGSGPTNDESGIECPVIRTRIRFYDH